LSGRGLCDKLIISQEESYRLWYVVVCDLETSWMRRSWFTGGCCAKRKEERKKERKKERRRNCVSINLQHIVGRKCYRRCKYPGKRHLVNWQILRCNRRCPFFLSPQGSTRRPFETS